VAVLAGREHDYERTARPLVHALELTHHFDIEVVSDFAAANSEKAKVVIAASDVPLESSEAERLIAFVRRGGGLILLHGTLATWSHDSSVAAMAGWTAGGPGPMTELIVKTVAGHPLTDRLPAEIVLEDELYLSEGPPAGADVLMRASWRFTDQVVAYTRGFGDGRFVHLGLGHGAAYQHPEVQRFVHRAALHAAGIEAAPSIGVGLIGYGAIARVHAQSIQMTPGLKLQAVCDVSADRRLAAQHDLGTPLSSRCCATPRSGWSWWVRHRARMRVR